jgi:hypothetical protein
VNDAANLPQRYQQIAALGGVAWLQRERLAAILELEGGSADAVEVIDADSGRMLAFLGPDFPPGDRFANIDAADLAELVKLFDHVDAWFAPRLRAVVCSTAYAIRHGWSTARDAHALINKSPVEIMQHRQGRRFVQMLVTAGISLARARGFFPALRGRPADETREFFLEQLSVVYEASTADLLNVDQVIVGTHTRHRINKEMRRALGFGGTTPEVGEKVLCLKNNRRLGLRNGTLWTVTAAAPLGGGFVEMTVKDDDGRAVEVVAPEEGFSSHDGAGADLPEQPFAFGYAITCHKAQGSQWAACW